MNNKDKLFSLEEAINNPYGSNCGNLNLGIEVNKCLFEMYRYLLTKDPVEREEKYTNFIETYEKLDKRGKEIIENEWIEIIERKNSKDKNKRKGDR